MKSTQTNLFISAGRRGKRTAASVTEGVNTYSDWETFGHTFLVKEHNILNKQERAGGDTCLDLLLHQRESARGDAGDVFSILDLSPPGITPSSKRGGGTSTVITNKAASLRGLVDA